MRSRLLVSSVTVLAILAAVAPRAAAQNEQYTDGLVSGDYLRIAGGSIAPVSPQGSLRDWGRGNTFGANWEGWYGGNGTDPGIVGFGFGADYSRMPLNESDFLARFTTPEGATATSASASSATVWSIETTLRARIPMPFIMPSLSFGLGYLDFHPSTVSYIAASGNGTTTQQHRRGLALMGGAGLDKHVVQRFGVFVEAVYAYGFTSLGQGIATPGGTCARNGCDVLKNTTLGTVRGGLRLQIGK
ncbi:MAG TPA: hypothetical protein VGM67_01265 [Gemmatimonadaceae bacterium]|jgi:hypothetical protein